MRLPKKLARFAHSPDQNLQLRLVEELQPRFIDNAPKPAHKSFRLDLQAVADVVLGNEVDVSVLVGVCDVNVLPVGA